MVKYFVCKHTKADDKPYAGFFCIISSILWIVTNLDVEIIVQTMQSIHNTLQMQQVNKKERMGFMSRYSKGECATL